MLVELFNTFCYCCEDKGQLSMISTCSQILSEIILIVFVSKCNMIEPKMNCYESNYMLKSRMLCHLTNLILLLHLLIFLWLLKHLLEEIIFEDETIYNFSIDSSLLLDINRTFNSTLIGKVF